MGSKYLIPNIIRTRGKELTFYKIDNDINGNPRYLFRYISAFNFNRDLVMRAVKSVGGKKFRGDAGGIVLCTYNLDDTLNDIFNYIEEHRDD